MKPTLPTCPPRQMMIRLVMLALFFAGFTQMQGLAQIYQFTNDSTGMYNSKDPNVTATGLGLGAGVVHDNYPPCGPTDGLGTDGWPTTNVFNVNTFNANGDYITFTITPNVGYGLEITGFSARSRRENLSGTANDGPLAIRYGYSIDGGLSWTTINPGNPQSSNLCASGGVNRVWPGWTTLNVSGAITFRIYGLSSGSAQNGDLFLRDVIVDGQVCANVPSITPAPGNFLVCQGQTSVDFDYTMENADTYAIDYDLDAEAEGFLDVGVTALPGAPGTIALVVPADATPGVYEAVLTLWNDCGFTGVYGFTIEVVARPTAVLSGDAEICLGESTDLSVDLENGSSWDIVFSDDLFTTYNTASDPYLRSVSPSSTTVYTIVSLSNENCDAWPQDISGSATVTVIGLPDVSISLSDLAICVDGDVTLTFTDNGATGHLFSITADLVDDNGTTVGAINYSNIPSGASDTYTEGVDFEGAIGGMVSLTNIVVTDETTGCEVSLADLEIEVDPLPDAAASDKTICSGANTDLEVTNPNAVAGSTFNWTADYGGVTGGAGSSTGVAFGLGAISENLVNTTPDPIVVQYTLTPIGPAPTFCEGSFFDVFITVDPAPQFGFSASTSSDPGGSGHNTAGPNIVEVDFCAGDLLTLYGYDDDDNEDIGYTVSYTTTGNVTFDGGALPLAGGPDNVAPDDAAGFFGTTYGGILGYGLSVGETYGVIDQLFVPYLDVDGSGTLTPGDCEGEPIRLIYNIYAPIVIDVVQNANDLCSGENVDYTISTTSTQEVLFDLTLDENSNGANPADLNDDNALPIELLALSLTSVAPYDFTQAVNNALGSFDRGRVTLTISNVRYADSDVACGVTINNPNQNTRIYPEPRLEEIDPFLSCNGSTLFVDLKLLGLPSSNPGNAGYPVRVDWTLNAPDIDEDGASGGIVIYNNAGVELNAGLDISQLLTLTNPLDGPKTATFTITPRAAGPSNAFNGDDCFGQPITVEVTVVPAAEPTIEGPTCVHEGGTIQLTGTDNVLPPASLVSAVWSDDGSGFATVDGDGLVTGVSPGSTTIYYTVTDDAGCVSTAQHVVTVLEPLNLVHVYTGPPVVCGDEFTVSVEVSNFCDISSLYYLFNWDPNVFQLVSYTPAAPQPLAGGTVSVSENLPGELTLAFDDDGNPPFGNSLSDGTVIMTYTLRAIGAGGPFNIPEAPPVVEAYNSNFLPVPTNTQGISVPIEIIALQLVGNPVICPSDPFVHLQYNNVVGNPNYYVIDFGPAAEAAGFPDIEEGQMDINDGEILIPVPNGIQNGSYSAILVVSNTDYGCVSEEYLFSIIVDQTPPTASNPDPLELSCLWEIPAPDPSVVDDEDDNCPGPLVVAYEPELSDTTGTGCSGNPMIINRVYSVTDVAGNTIYVTQTITVEDTGFPTVDTDLPNNWYPSLAAAEQAAIDRANATKEDNCSIPLEINVSFASVSTQVGCTWTIHLAVVDACGNLTLANYVTTVDDEDPTIDDPDPIDDCYGESDDPEAEHWPYQDAVDAAIAAVAAVANDNCTDPLDLVITAITSGTDCDLDIVVSVADACGRTTTYTYNTRVESDPPFIFTNPDALEGACFETEEQAIEAALELTEAQDDCGPASELQYDAFVSGGCPAEVMVVVTDYCGNFATITYTGVHIDDEAPSVDPDAIYPTCFQTLEQAYATLAAAANPSDNCTSTSELLESVEVTEEEVGDFEDPCLEYNISFTFTDNCGYSTVYTFEYITIDNVDPTAAALPDLEYDCVSEVDEPNIGVVEADDNCVVEDIVWLGDDLPTSCPGVGTRTYRVYDCAGNFVDVIQQIIINDDEAPTWTTPVEELDRAISCDDQSSIDNALSLEPEAQDNCGEVVITLVSSTELNTCAGGYVRVWTVVDDCGNAVAENYVQTITIYDNVAPTWVTLPEALDSEVECDDEDGLEAALEAQPVADDNCSGVEYEMVDRYFESYGTCVYGYLGYWVTEWVATDACGNPSATYFHYVYIYDNTGPDWDTPEGQPFPTGINITITCDDEDAYNFANGLEPQASDNCSNDVSLDKTTGLFVPGGDCPGEGSYTNTWVAYDDCGNASEVFTQTITVIDNTPPTFNPGCQFMPLNLFTGNGANCHEGISLEVGDEIDFDDSWTVAGIPIAPLGGCIDDNCTPLAAIIAEVVSITDETVESVEIDEENTAYCVRQITVSFQLRDLCGNVQEELFVCVYNVIDNTAPELFCDTRPEFGGPSIADCYPTVEAAEAAALETISPCDNCTDAEDLVVEASTVGTCEAEVTVTVTDCAQNSASYTFYTRIDNTPPSMTVSEIPTCYETLALAQASAIAATTITDDCDDYGDLDISVSTVGTCPATVTVTATDECGNSNSVAYPGLCIGTSTSVEITTEASNLNVDCIDWEADLQTWLDDNGGAEATGSGIVWSYAPIDPATVLEMSEANCTTKTKSVVVTFTATDGCGYTDSSVATFSVTDNTPPTANAIPNSNLSCSNGIPAANVNDVTGEADNCGDTPTVAWFATSDNLASGCPGDPRIVIHTYSVTDEYCNTTYISHMITVVDNVPPNFTAPANITINVDATCNYNASSGAAGDVTDESDNCTPAGPGLQAFYTDVVNPGVNFQEKYIITRTWQLVDACGNAAIPRIQTIVIKDVTPPTLVGCSSNLNLPSEQIEGECGGYFGPQASPAFDDNCDGESISYVLSGVTMGSGPGYVSPTQVFNEGETVVTYTVTDWVGNTASCSFTVTVNCLSVSGRIIWEHDDVSGVKDATVKLTQGGPTLDSDLSDTNGDYDLSIPAAGIYRITPVKNINRLNGVTSADATRITNHVNFSNPITDPYKKVCADVNRSGIINTQDATLITQCLAGNPTALAIFNVFWRFTPTDYVMPPTAHQAVPAFPEFKDVTVGANDVTGVDFFGMKIGDVDAPWADPQLYPVLPPLVWVLKDQTLMAGSEIEVVFATNNFNDLSSYQMDLDFDPSQLKFNGFQTMGALPMTLADNFGAYNAAQGELRSIWAVGEGMTLPDGAQVFKAKFQVLASGKKLSEVLRLDNSDFECQAFNAAMVPTGMKLVFAESVGTDSPIDPNQLTLQLLQNKPNPFTDVTTVGFILPEACEAQIRILDISGRELASYNRAYTAGYHELDFRMENAVSYGVLFCELQTPQGKRTIKMMTAK